MSLDVISIIGAEMIWQRIIGRILRHFGPVLKPFGPSTVAVPTKITVPRVQAAFIVPRRD